MNNLSSSRESEEIKIEKVIEEVVIEEKVEIDMKPIINQCNQFLLSIEQTYDKRSFKELHDAMIHVISAKRCLENINLN